MNGNALESSLTFSVIADVQYADKPPEEPRRYRDAIIRLQDFVAHCRQIQPSFVVQLGDLIDGGPDALPEMRQALEVLASLDRQRMMHVLGNHDFLGLDRKTVTALFGLQKGYYDFQMAGWRFVVLDTVEISVQGGWDRQSRNYRAAVDMMNTLQQVGADNARIVNGGMSREQIDWLDSVLDDTDSKQHKAFIFAHLPLLPMGHKHTLYNSSEVIEVLEAHPCVKVYMSGHRHAGGDMETEGIHYVGLEAMVETPDSGGWADVMLDDQMIAIRGYGNVSDRMLRLR